MVQVSLKYETLFCLLLSLLPFFPYTSLHFFFFLAVELSLCLQKDWKAKPKKILLFLQTSGSTGNLRSPIRIGSHEKPCTALGHTTGMMQTCLGCPACLQVVKKGACQSAEIWWREGNLKHEMLYKIA